MIIETLINLIYKVFALLTSPIQIDKLPESVSNALATGLEYISAGFGVVGQFTHLSYLLVLFGIILTVDVAFMVYKVVMWVIKKIPFLGIE